MLAQRLKCPKLVEGMKRDAMHVLGERVLFRRNFAAGFADDARDRCGLRQALLLHQKLKGAISPAAGRHLEHAGLLAFGIEDWPDVEALQQGPPRDVLSEVLDRDAGLDAADVGLAEHELVEGNVARGRQLDLLNGLCHVSSPRRAAESLSLGLQPVTERSAALLLQEGSATD